MGLDAALDRFWEAADACRLGIDAIQVVADNGPHGERRRIDDIRRDVFSVSKTVTSLAVGMLAGEGALSLDDPVLAHLPELADTAAAGSEAITVGHLLRMTAGNGYRWADDDADHPGDPARDFLATRERQASDADPLVCQDNTLARVQNLCWRRLFTAGAQMPVSSLYGRTATVKSERRLTQELRIASRDGLREATSPPRVVR